MPAWRRWVMVMVLVLLANDVAAQQTVVVTEFTYDDNGAIRGDIAEELRIRNDYEWIDLRVFMDEVDSFRMPLEDILLDPSLVQDVSVGAGVEAIVSGRLDRSRRAREIILSVHDGATGEELGTVSVELVGGRLDGESLDWGLAELESFISWTTPLDSGPADPPPRQRERPSGELDLVASDDESGSPSWIHVGAGLDITSRSFTLVAADQSGIQYESGFYPGVEGTIRIHPVAAFAPGVADGLSIQLRVARYFVETLLLNEDESVLDIPTRHKELGIRLGYSHPAGPLALEAWVGYESLAYVLGSNEVYDSSSYDGIAVGLGARYHVVDDLLSFGFGGEVRPSPTLGDPELVAFGEGSALGFGFGVDAALLLFDAVELSGFFTYRSFSTDYAGGGTAQLEGALEASDTFQYFGARLGYVY